MTDSTIQRKVLDLNITEVEQEVMHKNHNIFGKIGKKNKIQYNLLIILDHLKENQEKTFYILMSIYVFLILGTFWNRAVFIDVAKEK